MASYSSAKEFVSAVIAQYRAMKNYTDTGYVQVRLQAGHYVIYFQTALGEGGDFRFTFDRPHPYRPLRHKVTRQVVGRCRGKSYLSSNSPDGSSSVELIDDFDMAIAGATGISGGAAHTIASLLFDEVGGWSLADLTRPRLRSPKKVDGISCYRVTGLHGRYPVTLFVGIDDLIIRKISCRRLNSDEVRLDVDTLATPAPEYFDVPRAEA